MANTDFFDENEKVDIEKLAAFNELTGLFDCISKAPEKHHTDASAFTTNKFGETRCFNIELKNRNLNLLPDGRISGCTKNGKEFFDTTIFIEAHKVADMLLDEIIGLEPLYINFLLDGHVVIYHLSKLKKRPFKTGTMNIRSKGYNKFEIAKRQSLYLTDAVIYDKNGNLIKKMGEDFI